MSIPIVVSSSAPSTFPPWTYFCILLLERTTIQDWQILAQVQLPGAQPQLGLEHVSQPTMLTDVMVRRCIRKMIVLLIEIGFVMIGLNEDEQSGEV